MSLSLQAKTQAVVVFPGPVQSLQGLVHAALTKRRWEYAQAESHATLLTFKIGVTALSWGATLQVGFEQHGPDTQVTYFTRERWGMTDWGRAKRLIRDVSAELAAQTGVTPPVS